MNKKEKITVHIGEATLEVVCPSMTAAVYSNIVIKDPSGIELFNVEFHNDMSTYTIRAKGATCITKTSISGASQKEVRVEYNKLMNYQDQLVSDSNLSVRTLNVLMMQCSNDHDYYLFKDIPKRELKLSDLTKYSHREYLKLRNFGKKSINEVELYLGKRGFKFKNSDDK